MAIIKETTQDTGGDYPLTVTLEKQDSPTSPRYPYNTYISYDGGLTPMLGHYNMTLTEAEKSYKRRIRIGG